MSDLPLSTTLLVLVLILALSGFLSMSEASLFSLGRHQRELLKREGGTSARFIELLLYEPYKLIITILLGDEILNVAYASIIALTVRRVVEGTSEETLSLISLAIASPTLLLLGEIGPKTIGVRYPRTVSRIVSFPLYYLHMLITPARLVIMVISIAIARLLGVRIEQAQALDARTKQDLMALVGLGGEHGVVTEIEKNLVANLFKLEDITANKIMTPVIECFFLPADMTLEEAVPRVKQRGFSRIPVYQGEKDNIVGILFAKDLLTADPSKVRTIGQILRPPYFIPRTKKCIGLLTEFQLKRIHMAIVVDEYGRLDGIVTMEDILEELFGEFKDERRLSAGPYFMRENRSFYIQGGMKIEDFNDTLLFNILHFGGLETLGDDIERSIIPMEEGSETIGGFVFNLFGRLPQEGEQVVHGSLIFTVTKVTGKRIAQLKVERIEKEETNVG